MIAEKKECGTFQIVGAGDSAAQGVKGGEVSHPGDATESIVEALKKAERSSGTKIEKLYYNIDDSKMQSVITRGSIFLTGEGEIRPSDIEEAGKIAERLASHFEKNILYSKEIQFVIDDRDSVINPIGAFGKKLEVFVHVLQARSSLCEAWQKLMMRSQVSRCTAVPSAWSSAYGVLPKEDRINKKLILDLGKDFFNALTFVNDRITGYKVLLNQETEASMNGAGFSEWVKESLLLNPDIQEILVTGDLAQEPVVMKDLEGAGTIPLRIAAPQAIEKLRYPRYASVVGLLDVADETESRMPMMHADKNIFLNLKEKAVLFISEYF